MVVRLFNIMVVLLCLAGFSPNAISQTQSFFVSIPDLPLMSGLVEMQDLTMSFDKPEGRIVESVADIQSLQINDIRSYYEMSLPQLGWSRLAEDTYVRQNEVLRLNFEFTDGHDYLKVMVRPKG